MIEPAASDSTSPSPSNVRQRVLTALIALPVTLGLLFWLPWFWAATLVFGLLAVGLLEWARLSDASGFTTLLLSLLMLGLGPLVVVAEFLGATDLSPVVLVLGSLCWLYAFFLILAFPASARLLPPRLRGLMGALLLACAWLAFTAVKQREQEWLILWWLMILWVADSGAYFAGKRWGRRRLAPSVSPGKTIEGALAGVLAAVTVGGSLGLWVADVLDLGRGVIFWILASLTLALVSIVGDLFASLVKRLAGAKDSGGLFPGHGGVLDRLDSALATAPLLALGVHWLA